MKKTKKAVLFILENILGKEKILSVTTEEGDDTLIIRIQVQKDSIGKLIGREGKTIKAIRNLLRIISFRETGKKLLVDVVKEEKAG